MFKYMDDGANYQARAVLAYLTQPDGIEQSWDEEKNAILQNQMLVDGRIAENKVMLSI